MKRGWMHSIFPQEVCDIIIDHCHDDKAALVVCGLVCRAWVPASRYHLFNEVKVVLDNSNNVARLLERLRCSVASRSIARYIRKVNIRYNNLKATEKELDLLYEALPTLRDTTRYLAIALDGFPLHFEKLYKVLPLDRITDVEATLSNSLYRFGNFDTLMDFFGSMPNLHRLSLEAITNPPEKRDGVIEGAILLPQLRALTILFSDIIPLLRALATPPLLSVVRFEVKYYAEEMHCVSSFLRPIMPCLVEFHLVLLLVSAFSSIELYIQGGVANYCSHFADLKDVVRDLCLNMMSSLSNFHLHFLIRDDWRYIPTVLDSITSQNISHVKFTLELSTYVLSPEDSWVEVASIIARSNYRHLRKLEFRLIGERSGMDKVEGWISRQLRNLEHPDILHVCWESMKVGGGFRNFSSLMDSFPASSRILRPHFGADTGG
jgi:hypothetical protein